jgi:hypothetical protein
LDSDEKLFDFWSNTLRYLEITGTQFESMVDFWAASKGTMVVEPAKKLSIVDENPEIVD